MNNKAIIKIQLAEQDKAENLFREVLRRGAERNNILAVIADDPKTALARLNDTRTLTNKGSADMLDEIIGQIHDESRARELLEQELSPARLHELLVARGDLPSSVAYIASIEDILHAIFIDISEIKHEEADKQKIMITTEEDALANNWETYEDLESDEEDYSSTVIEFDSNDLAPLYVLRTWAYKLKDRNDYEEFLNTIVIGKFNVLQCILLAFWYESGCPAIVHNSLNIDSLNDLGIDLDMAEDAMRELFDLDLPTFSRAEIEEARLQWTKLRQIREQAPSLIKETREEASRVADKLDF